MKEHAELVGGLMDCLGSMGARRSWMGPDGAGVAAWMVYWPSLFPSHSLIFWKGGQERTRYAVYDCSFCLNDALRLSWLWPLLYQLPK